MAKPKKFDGNCSDAPDIKSYYALWGKHEFGMEEQRNLLLWFLAEKGLDADFMAFLDQWWPEDEDEVRISREEMEAKVKKLQERLARRG